MGTVYFSSNIPRGLPGTKHCAANGTQSQPASQAYKRHHVASLSKSLRHQGDKLGSDRQEAPSQVIRIGHKKLKSTLGVMVVRNTGPRAAGGCDRVNQFLNKLVQLPLSPQRLSSAVTSQQRTAAQKAPEHRAQAPAPLPHAPRPLTIGKDNHPTNWDQV